MPNVAKCGAERAGWREDLKAAIRAEGHTQDSFGASLGISQSQVARLFDPFARRPLNADLLERMRDCVLTHGVWRRFMELHAQRSTAADQAAVG